METWSWQLDGWIVLTGILCAIAASLLGNFLILRRLSMLGDAITHAVLPGLAVAFFVSQSRSSLPMFLGAVVVGVMTALFTEWIRKFGRVDEGASMGVVFTSLFALGLVMIVQAADKVDLDASCVLFGSLELTPLDTISILGYNIPRAVLVLGSVTTINALFVLVFFKELKISSFDPDLATATGFSASWMHYLLMILVAVTAVASFESVGNILVVAMFIVPPAAAYLLTDRLAAMIAISVVLAALSATLGHVAALEVPHWFGFRSTTTAGMMAVMAGLLLLLAATLSPRHGIVAKFFRRKLLTLQILADDIVALLYRLKERGQSTGPEWEALRSILLADRFSFAIVMRYLKHQGQIEPDQNGVRLTETGVERALRLVRSHRLWEQYLTLQAGVDVARLHDKAERLEHFTDRKLLEQLDRELDAPTLDPHGTPIPVERSDNP